MTGLDPHRILKLRVLDPNSVRNVSWSSARTRAKTVKSVPTYKSVLLNIGAKILASTY